MRRSLRTSICPTYKPRPTSRSCPFRKRPTYAKPIRWEFKPYPTRKLCASTALRVRRARRSLFLTPRRMFPIGPTMFARCYRHGGHYEYRIAFKLPLAMVCGLRALGSSWAAERLGAMAIPMGPGNTEKQLQMMQDLHSPRLSRRHEQPMRFCWLRRSSKRGMRDKHRPAQGRHRQRSVGVKRCASASPASWALRFSTSTA